MLNEDKCVLPFINYVYTVYIPTLAYMSEGLKETFFICVLCPAYHLLYTIISKGRKKKSMTFLRC